MIECAYKIIIKIVRRFSFSPFFNNSMTLIGVTLFSVNNSSFFFSPDALHFAISNGFSVIRIKCEYECKLKHSFNISEFEAQFLLDESQMK